MGLRRVYAATWVSRSASSIGGSELTRPPVRTDVSRSQALSMELLTLGASPKVARISS